MTIEYKFFAKNNKEDEVRALESLKKNIENKRKDSTETIKSTILPICNRFGVTSFSIVLKCEGEFDHCGYKARMNNPERITNLLHRFSEKTGVNYEVFTPEKMYREMTRIERFTRNGVSYNIRVKLESFAERNRLSMWVNARDTITGNCINDFPWVSFIEDTYVPESYIQERVDEIVKMATKSLKNIIMATKRV